MKVDATINLNLSLTDLASALAKSPSEFAQFWFEFSRIVDSNSRTPSNPLGQKVNLEPFGRAMAEAFDSARQEPFVAIMDFMRYYNRKASE